MDESPMFAAINEEDVAEAVGEDQDQTSERMLREYLPKEDRKFFFTDEHCSSLASVYSSNSVINLLELEDERKQEAPLVLIVDDEPMNVFVVQSLLQQEGV